MSQFKCKDCSKIVTSELRLEQHKKACPKCKVCGKVYNDMTYLRKHMKLCTENDSIETKSHNFIQEYVQSYLHGYTKESYLELHYGVATFIINLAKTLFTNNVSEIVKPTQLYACTDTSRNKFFRFINGMWVEDKDGNFIGTVMEMLYPFCRKYYLEIHDGYIKQGFNRELAEKLEGLVRFEKFNSGMHYPFENERLAFYPIRKYVSSQLKVTKLPTNYLKND